MAEQKLQKIDATLTAFLFHIHKWYKTEFTFIEFPDVDSSDGGALCSICNLTGHGLKSHFSLEFFFQLGFFAQLIQAIVLIISETDYT